MHTHTCKLYNTCKQWLTKHLCEKYFANKSFFALKSGAYTNETDTSTNANTSNGNHTSSSLYGNGATGVFIVDIDNCIVRLCMHDYVFIC
jgi:ABC-type uncharacterized transport system fused permease/ATPase subunit